MKTKILVLLALLLSCNLCFAKISVLSFEIYEITDYDDMDDNFLVFNKTDKNIARLFLYGIKESDSPRGFNMEDFIVERDDHHIILKEKAELICMIKDIKKNKHVKKYLTEQLLHKYRYFILVIDGMMPEEYDYKINRMFARHDDFYIHIGDNDDRYTKIKSSESYVDSDYKAARSERNAQAAQNTINAINDFMLKANDTIMEAVTKCPTCDGSGKCKYCQGRGTTFSGLTCPNCNGSGKRS